MLLDGGKKKKIGKERASAQSLMLKVTPLHQRRLEVLLNLIHIVELLPMGHSKNSAQDTSPSQSANFQQNLDR